jgi:hypothetical protein
MSAVSASPLVAKAQAMGLPATAAILATVPPQFLDPAATPRDARLDEPPALQPKRLLGQLPRRGLDPRLVRALWPTLAERPLERALIASDVLAQSIFSSDDGLVGELRQAVRRLGKARPAPGQLGVDLNAHPAATLLATVARDPALERRPTPDLLALAYEFHLGALDELGRRGDPLLAKADVRASVLAYARLLQLAHLPSLASVYLDWLSRALGQRTAALPLCETLFDAEAPRKIPGDAIRRGDVPDAELNDVAEYLVYRSLLALGDAGRAQSMAHDSFARREPDLGPPSLRLDVVRAHLGAIFPAPNGAGVVPLARVEQACCGDRLWRYAAQVRVAVAARSEPARALQLWHDYLTGFGNDYGCGYDLLQSAPEPVRRDGVRLLAREAFFLPHERAPWKLLAMSLGDKAAVHAAVTEIDGRLRAQAEP